MHIDFVCLYMSQTIWALRWALRRHKLLFLPALNLIVNRSIYTVTWIHLLTVIGNAGEHSRGRRWARHILCWLPSSRHPRSLICPIGEAPCDILLWLLLQDLLLFVSSEAALSQMAIDKHSWALEATPVTPDDRDPRSWDHPMSTFGWQRPPWICGLIREVPEGTQGSPRL